MSEEEPTKPSKTSLSMVARLLRFWANNRRILLAIIITIALVAFLNSLSTETRRSLIDGLLANRALIVLLLFFNLLTLSLLWSTGQRLDTWFFLFLNLRGHHPLWLDRIMWVLTQIGSGFLGLFAGIVLYFAQIRRLALGLILGILSLWLVVEVVKALVERRRPYNILEGMRVVGWHEWGLSFPSGHTAQSFFMATLLAHYFQADLLLNALFYGIAVAVGFTRIYVGAHYPRDVLAGAMIGSVWGILTGLVQVYLSTGRF